MQFGSIQNFLWSFAYFRNGSLTAVSINASILKLEMGGGASSNGRKPVEIKITAPDGMPIYRRDLLVRIVKF